MVPNQGHLVISVLLVVTTWGKGNVIGTQWVEAKDAGNHPTMQQYKPHNKESLTQNVNSTEVEKQMQVKYKCKLNISILNKLSHFSMVSFHSKEKPRKCPN